MNEQTFQGHWNEIKGQLRSKWGALTDDDVMSFNGNLEQLIGAIQQRTGEARESIEQFFTQVTANGAAAINNAGEAVRARSQQATEAMQQSSQQAAASVRQGYEEVEALVRQRPAESLAVCFGVGIVTGVLVTLFLGRR